MAIKKVCVVGSGTMDNGIVQIPPWSGYETIMMDIRYEFVDRGINAVKTSFGKFVEKGKMKRDEMDRLW